MTLTSSIRLGAAALISAGLVWAQEPVPGAGSPGGGARQANRIERVAIALGLSADQKTQVQTIVEKRASQSEPLLAQLRENRQAIDQMVKSGATGSAFDTQLQALAGTEASLVSQMTVIRAKAASQIWALLSAEQRQRTVLVPELLDPDAPGGSRGGGPPNRLRSSRPGQF
jgi:Spy/CpxP family protein refolding chaperone